MLLGLVLLLFALIPYPALRQYFDRLAIDGQAEFFSEEFAASLRLRVFLSAVFLSSLSALLWNFRSRITEAVYALQIDHQSFLVRAAPGVPHTWLYRAAVLSCVLCALIVRLPFLNRSICYDEAYSYLTFATKPLLFGLSSYLEPNNHLLHTALMRASMLLFGDDLWALRLPAFIAGLLSLVLLFCFGSAYANRRAALFAVVLFACSAPAVEYGTLARGYSLLNVFFLLLCLGAHHQLLHRNNTFLTASTAVISALGIYTVPTFLFGWFGVLLWQLSNRVHVQGRSLSDAASEFCRDFAATAVLTLLLYLPPLIVHGPQQLFANEHVSSKGLAYVLAEGPASLAWTWSAWHLATPAWAAVSCLLLFGVAILFGRASTGKRLSLFLCALAAALLLCLVLEVVPYRRAWLYLLPLYFLYVGIGIDIILRKLPRQFRSVAAVSTAGLLLLLVATQVQLLRSNFRGTFHSDQGTLRDAARITAWLGPQLKQGDVVLTIAPADSPMRYYFSKAGYPLSFLDQSQRASKRLIVIQNHEPYFSKGGTARYQSLQETLDQNGYSSQDVHSAYAKKHFPFSSVYFFNPTK